MAHGLGRPTKTREKWIGSEFQPTLTPISSWPNEVVHQGRRAVPWDEDQRGVETITTHEYESKVLAKAFTEITGIKVTHDLLQEGDVVEKLQTRCSRTRTSMTAGSTTPT
jgi:glycerol transport system substrate-binding protein